MLFTAGSVGGGHYSGQHHRLAVVQQVSEAGAHGPIFFFCFRIFLAFVVLCIVKVCFPTYLMFPYIVSRASFNLSRAKCLREPGQETSEAGCRALLPFGRN